MSIDDVKLVNFLDLIYFTKFKLGDITFFGHLPFCGIDATDFDLAHRFTFFFDQELRGCMR